MPDFGIGETIAAGLASAGVGAETAGALAPILAGVGEGAIGGGAISGLTGGNIGKGALGGAITGGFIPAGGELLGGTIGTTAADALGGVAGGALGSEATGQKVLPGALEGGIAGGISGALAPSTPSAGGGGGGPTSAAGSAAPSSVGGASGADLTSLDPTSLNNTINSLNSNLGGAGGGDGLGSVGSSASTLITPNVGTGTVGTPSVGNAASGGFDLNGGFGGTSPANVASQLAGGAAKAPTSFDSFVSNPGIGTGFDVLKANPGAAISAAGIGLDALKGNQALEGERQLKSEAGTLAGQGNQLASYLQSGTLPPGLQAGITQASDAAKATIRSQYASRGMSGSSAEQQDLAAVDSRAEAQGAQMAMQLLQTGISETGLASGLYEQLLNESLTNDKTLSTAIGNFASAAAGGGGLNSRGGITISQTPAG